MSYFSKSTFVNLYNIDELIEQATYVVISLDHQSDCQRSDGKVTECCWMYAGFSDRPPIWLAMFDRVADICAAADAIQADHPDKTVWHEKSKGHNQLPYPSYYYLAELCVMGDDLVDLLREHRHGKCPANDPRLLAHLQIRDRWYLRAAFGVGAHHMKARATSPRVNL